MDWFFLYILKLYIKYLSIVVIKFLFKINKT